MLERRADKGLVGNIYLAKVQRVLPGMQAAFLDLGLEKSAFLYVGDILPQEYFDEAEFNPDKYKRIKQKQWFKLSIETKHSLNSLRL